MQCSAVQYGVLAIILYIAVHTNLSRKLNGILITHPHPAATIIIVDLWSLPLPVQAAHRLGMPRWERWVPTDHEPS